MKDEWMYEQAAEYDRILGQTTGLLAQRGDEQAVALLVDVRSITLADTGEVIRTEKVFDPWAPTGDDGPAIRTVYRRAAVDVDDHLVSRFTEEVCQRIAETLSYVAERKGEENVAYVRPRPALPEADDDWRTAYAARLASDRPSNQARRESVGGAHPVEDGLTFGSAEEIRVYRALKRLQARFPQEDTISIAPLPSVRLRTGNTWSPDALVMGRGRVLIVEIDGPHHRGPRRYVDDRTATCSGSAAEFPWYGWPSRTCTATPRSAPGSMRRSCATSVAPAEALCRSGSLEAEHGRDLEQSVELVTRRIQV